MKRSRFTGMVLSVLLAFASSGWALTLADVGTVDEKIAQTYLANSSDANELAWVRSILGEDTYMNTKYDVTGSDWQMVTDADNTYALNLQSDPPATHFLVKIGIGGNDSTDQDTHFLFENKASYEWAVVALVDLGYAVSIKGVDRISHIDEFGAVPEPGTILLLGSGLLGLGLYGRKRAKA